MYALLEAHENFDAVAVESTVSWDGAHVCDAARLPFATITACSFALAWGVAYIRSLTHPPISCQGFFKISYYKITITYQASVPFYHLGSQVRICRREPRWTKT